jgi:hypothetical protein
VMLPAHPLIALFDALLAFGHSTICTVWERDCPEAESLLRDWCAVNDAELIECGKHVSAFRNGRTLITIQRQEIDQRGAVDTEQMWIVP